jgi:hypothetical protein
MNPRVRQAENRSEKASQSLQREGELADLFCH